ncbi:(deoxy)nucleoside triphosphate pyrophosphohydrolase [Desulforamulus aeronauticus]|uniref:8-oxo-dGTP diphosphatase n=1 Tax=Desulforamulus aeronauticus DSM 10349 TaxID=1121421 RepID=A0A1M6VHX6_9FIRM|nr:(deoxy)nucleoside triphosphate pyrophosphohydrolase [Desulforamulus aeronauticus]SHK80971.1 8-oxo-dGTP diphosphatase [Desulforamulus aeronauticus DSM 10349]
MANGSLVVVKPKTKWHNRKMHTIIVTAAIIQRAEKILIAQRKGTADHGLKWEFPGGKLHFGEDPKAGLKREIQEELDMEIEVGPIFEVVSHLYGERHILLLCYTCRYLGSQPSTKDCQDFRWVTPQEMRDFDFTEADLPVVEKLQAYP